MERARIAEGEGVGSRGWMQQGAHGQTEGGGHPHLFLIEGGGAPEPDTRASLPPAGDALEVMGDNPLAEGLLAGFVGVCD